MRDDHMQEEWKRNRDLDEEMNDDLVIEDDLDLDEEDDIAVDLKDSTPILEAKKKKKSSPWKKRPKFLLRSVIAAALLLVTILLFQNPMNAKLDDFMKNALNNNTDFASIRNLMENALGRGNPTLLPAFTPQVDSPFNPPATPVQTEPTTPDFGAPVDGGKIIAPFSDKNPGLTIETVGKVPVNAVADGEITEIGTVNDWENVVVVRHADGTETWYQGMEDITVSVKQKVKKGEQLGTTAENNGKHMFSIYYFHENELKNPSEVIPIEP